MIERKPYLKYPVRGDVINPWVYDGSDWVKIDSPEGRKLREDMLAEVRAKGWGAIRRGWGAIRRS